MKKDKPDIYIIVFWLVFCFLFVLVPILWLIPLSFGNSVEFTVYYEDSAYFTNERAVGIDILLDGVYYGTTDEFGVLEIRTLDQENHTLSILYNDGVVYEYLIEYGTETVLVDVFLETKSIEATFSWNFDSQDLIIGEQFELWIYKADVWQFVGTKTTDSLGMVLFDGLIIGKYKFIGVDFEIPVVLIELDQTTAFKSVDFLAEPITVMFDFDYSDSLIFGVDYPIEGLEYTFWRYEVVDATGSIPEDIELFWDWVEYGSGTTDVDGRLYFYNLETFERMFSNQVRWAWSSDQYKITWAYDGTTAEQIFYVGDDLDFFNELSCKEVIATFNWDSDGYPLATNMDVVLTFLDDTHTPMTFTTDMNGQLNISGLIMGNYDLEGFIFGCIQPTHSKVIPQILLEPTKDRGVLKFWFKKHHVVMLFILFREVASGFLSFGRCVLHTYFALSNPLIFCYFSHFFYFFKI